MDYQNTVSPIQALSDLYRVTADIDAISTRLERQRRVFMKPEERFNKNYSLSNSSIFLDSFTQRSLMFIPDNERTT